MASVHAQGRIWRWLALGGIGGIVVAFVALEVFDSSVLTAQRITGAALSMWFVALARSKHLRGIFAAVTVALVTVTVADVAGVLPHLVALVLTLPLGLSIMWAPSVPRGPASG